MAIDEKKANYAANADALSSAELFASRVREFIDDQAIVILFGSFAKDTSHAKSDIDIAVISKVFSIDTAANCGKLGSIIFDVNASIESHPFSIDDWSHSTPFKEEIIRTGVVL